MCGLKQIKDRDVEMKVIAQLLWEPVENFGGHLEDEFWIWYEMVKQIPLVPIPGEILSTQKVLCGKGSLND